MNKKFEEAVDRQITEVWKAPTSHQAEAVRKVLVMLYRSISRRASVGVAVGIPAIKDSDKKSIGRTQSVILENSAFFFQIQQIICLTPLRFFLQVLSEDTHFHIKVAALGELSDRIELEEGKARIADIMGKANRNVDLEASKRFLEEINNSELIQRAFRLWEVSGLKIPFSPEISMKINGEPINSKQ